MVKSRRRPTIRRRPFLTVFIILLIALAGLGAAKLITYLTRSSSDISTSDTPSPTPHQEINTPSDTPDNNSNEGKPLIIQNEGTDPNTLENITGAITTSRVSGEKFILRLSIDQFLTTGTCSLKMTSGDLVYSTSAPIIADASTSTCEGFDIPISALSSGRWVYVVDFTSETKTGSITGEITL